MHLSLRYITLEEQNLEDRTRVEHRKVVGHLAVRLQIQEGVERSLQEPQPVDELAAQRELAEETVARQEARWRADHMEGHWARRRLRVR